ncbi:hypothetical protein ACIQXW_15340 [Lysinibacillus sp. NPDC097162]|uniref:hypothetical protein n=1 Tax=Lysinibacillus sp. NPDC097162 TaxID=3364140 RepID=UPI0038188661
MPEKMLFSSVIESQGVPFIAHITGESGYEDGEWVEGKEEPKGMTGIILPLSSDDLKYLENGKYTEKEKKLLTVDQIPEGTKVEYKGQLFTVQAFKDYSDYTDVNIYLMRWRAK